MRHRNILPREVVGAPTVVRGLAGPGSEPPRLMVRVPVPCRTSCPFRVPSHSDHSMILCRILTGRTPVDTRNKRYGMRAEQLQQAAAAATNILTWERQRAGQRAPGRPPVPPGTPPCPAARGPAGEKRGGCGTSSSGLRRSGLEEPEAGRADSSTAPAQPEQPASSWGAVCGHCKGHETARATEKPTAHLENNFSEFLFPTDLLQEVVVVSDFQGHSLKEEHSYVLQDKGNVLPTFQAAGEEGHGVLDAALPSLPGHRGSGSHLTVFQGLHLLMG